VLDTEGGMEIVSCGEDGSVLVWSGGELLQSLPHPCCVWAVKALPGTGAFRYCMVCVSDIRVAIICCCHCGAIAGVLAHIRSLLSLMHTSMLVLSRSTLMCSSFAFYPGGDFVTCGDDGFLRIFSRNPAKTGSERVQQLQQELALAVRAAAERSATGPSAEEIAKAPRWEERAQHPGKSADQVSAR
jgi:hypothetical protein